MAVHGAQSEAQRRRDYIQTELMSLGERLRVVEGQLADTKRRLIVAEAMIARDAAEVGSVPSCPC